MMNLADPAITRLRVWHDQQNPLFRVFAEPMVASMTDVLTTMQAEIDRQASQIKQLEEQLQTAVGHVQAAAAQVEAAQAAAAAQVEAVQAAAAAQTKEHDLALQVTKDRIDQLERRIFGRQSERTKTPDARGEARKRHRKALSDEERKAQRRAAAKARQDKLDKLRTVVLDLPLGADVPEGRPLPPEESVLYEWHPGDLVRVVVRREQRVLPDGSIVTAPPPPQVIEGGSYGPGLHAKVAMDKSQDAIPLRRQERIFERVGAPLPISVLCALYHRTAEAMRPLYQRMLHEVGSAAHVSADETPQPVLDEDKVRKGWMWVFASEDVILYVFSPSRGGSVPAKVLGRSKGTLTVDGHTGYNIVTGDGRRERGGCWSHGRRGLYEARGYAEGLVDELLALIGKLFDVEHRAIEHQLVGTEAHLALRQKESAPVVAAIFSLVEKHIGSFDARSSLAKAMRYLLNQREPLSLFLKDARVPIHNNLSERALRIVALLRKTSLFVADDEGGDHLAMLLTMAATCRLHGVDPERWVENVLIGMSERGITVEDLLPWNWKMGRGATFKPTFQTGLASAPC